MQRSLCLLLLCVLVCCAALSLGAAASGVSFSTGDGELTPSQGATQPLDLLAVETKRSDDAHEQSAPRQARQILGVYPYGGYGYWGGYKPFYSSYYPTYGYYYPRYYGFYPSYGYGYGYPRYFYG